MILAATIRILIACILISFGLRANFAAIDNASENCFRRPADSAVNWPGKRLPTLIERWQAELILLGEVVETKFEDGGQFSRIRVISAIKWKETNVAGEVKVFIQMGSHWPYTFQANTKVLAFLKFDDNRGCYVDFNDRDGGFEVDQATGEFYVERYSKLGNILKIEQPTELLNAKRDWYVKLGLNPSTRTEAAYGIRILWGDAKRKELLRERAARSPGNWLTDEQKASILAVIAKEEPDWNAYEMIKLLKDVPSVEIDQYLMKAIRQSLTDDQLVPCKNLTIAHLAFELLPDRLGIPLTRSLETASKAYYDQMIDYSYHISIGDEYSEAEKVKAKNALIKEWRKLASALMALVPLEQSERGR